MSESHFRFKKVPFPGQFFSFSHHDFTAFKFIFSGGEVKKAKLIVLFCLLFAVSFSACSTKTVKPENKTKEEYAREIIELTDVSKLMDQVMAQIKQMQNNMVAQMGISEEEKEKVTEFQDKVQEKIAEILDFNTMETEFIDLFTSVYSMEELKAISEFYKTPAGKSMIAKQPMVLQKSMQIAQEKVKILIPELQKLVEEMKQK